MASVDPARNHAEPRAVDGGRATRRAWHRALCGALFVAAALGPGSSGCGFGTYDDAASPQATSANSGVPNSGQWWPWVCTNGSRPSPQSTPLHYKATGRCGPGGAFALSVDGCEMVGDWTVLGLSDVTTNIPASTPAAGGWEIAGTAALAGGGDGGGAIDDSGDGGRPWTCDSSASPSGTLTFTCTLGVPAVTVCESTLIPVSP